MLLTYFVRIVSGSVSGNTSSIAGSMESSRNLPIVLTTRKKIRKMLILGIYM